jgi:hypothetical protein
MSEALSFAEIDSQHVELLPARTVLSLFTVGGGKVNNCGIEQKNNLVLDIGILDALGILSGGGQSDSSGLFATTNCSNS